MVCNKVNELRIGTKIEYNEHKSIFPKNKQREMAEKIAKNHISEFPCYYSKGLIPMERRLKK